MKGELNTSLIGLRWGRFIPEKGFDVLINAYYKYYNENFLPLYIYGEGPELDNLTYLIKKYNLNQKIFLRKFVTNPYSIIKNAKGCIISSRIEGFPNILNEMIYLNNNILSTICVPEISNIDFIFTCLSNDIDSLGVSLNCLLINSFSSEDIVINKMDYLRQLSTSKYIQKIFPKT